MTTTQPARSQRRGFAMSGQRARTDPVEGAQNLARLQGSTIHAAMAEPSGIGFDYCFVVSKTRLHELHAAAKARADLNRRMAAHSRSRNDTRRVATGR